MTDFVLRRPLVVVAMVCLSLMYAGLLVGPVCAAEKEEEKVVEKTKTDILNAKEDEFFFGSTVFLGCVPMPSLIQSESDPAEGISLTKTLVLSALFALLTLAVLAPTLSFAQAIDIPAMVNADPKAPPTFVSLQCSRGTFEIHPLAYVRP